METMIEVYFIAMSTAKEIDLTALKVIIRRFIERKCF